MDGFPILDPFGMNYLYSRKKFGWDAPDFALFRVALYSSMAFGNFVKYISYYLNSSLAELNRIFRRNASFEQLL